MKLNRFGLLLSLAQAGFMLSSAPLGAAEEETKLLRFPAIHKDQVVFTHAGDLYTVERKGGVARKLTTHVGNEMFPRFSPDGSQIAFTGQYDGNTEIYLIPNEGGVPKRLTTTATLRRDEVSDRMGPNNICMGWRNAKEIVFRSRMTSFNDFLGGLYSVDTEGRMPSQLPVPRGGFCSFSADGSKMVYNRVFREFRTWKRYRGGMCDDIWLHDFNAKTTVALTDTRDQEIIPMWIGSKVYFLSDRDEKKRMNLYVYDTEKKDVRQLTKFTDFDVKFPSNDADSIVFEYGGEIHRFDLKTEKTEKVTVRILDDSAMARTALMKVGQNIASGEIAPDGKRVVYTARGDVFSVPAKEGFTRNLTNTPGVHERSAVWSPDGKHIAFISDETGENEIYIVPQMGGKAVQLTKGADTYYYTLEWSPDSTKILFNDKKLRLRYVDVISREVTLVAQSKSFEYNNFGWSPDSKWICYTQIEDQSLDKVFIYGVDTKRAVAVTDGWYDAGSACFSGDGKYLFFVSSRDFNPTFSQVERNFMYQNMARVYAVVLAKATPAPFIPKSDEVEVKEKKDPPVSFGETGLAQDAKQEKKPETTKPAESKEGSKPAPKPAEPVKVVIDEEGLADRVVRLPVDAGNYFGLGSVDDKVFYYGGPSGAGRAGLSVYDLSDKKATRLGDVQSYSISADQKKMLVNKDGAWAVIDLPTSEITIKDKVSTDGMEVMLDRSAEWHQIFDECWRQMRDFVYDPNLHGNDWKAIGARYRPLVKHVKHRADLTYIIGEMIAELNLGHAYAGGGDLPNVPKVELGLLGAELDRDPSGFPKITKIFKGENWNPANRSPLTEPGVDAKVGDFILAINGKSTKEVANPMTLLINTVGKQVKLTLSSKPEGEGARQVTVVPIANEASLYYLDWVNKNIETVNKATKGEVGYLHIPDMLSDGLNEFAKRFYPQLRKKALIIDVRGNGGGNVSPLIIERLRREAAMVSIARNTQPQFEPADSMEGPKVCLLNEFSASDGDIFPYRFRHYKLGKLIGKRSWGGVVGIRGPLPLLDGGDLRRPEFSRYDLEGKEWVMEGKGVEPDIVVDNDPSREFAGEDDQLARGIAEILKELETKRKTVPKPPTYPVR